MPRILLNEEQLSWICTGVQALTSGATQQPVRGALGLQSGKLHLSLVRTSMYRIYRLMKTSMLSMSMRSSAILANSPLHVVSILACIALVSGLCANMQDL